MSDGPNFRQGGNPHQNGTFSLLGAGRELRRLGPRPAFPQPLGRCSLPAPAQDSPPFRRRWGKTARNEGTTSRPRQLPPVGASAWACRTILSSRRGRDIWTGCRGDHRERDTGPPPSTSCAPYVSTPYGDRLVQRRFLGCGHALMRGAPAEGDYGCSVALAPCSLSLSSSSIGRRHPRQSTPPPRLLPRPGPPSSSGSRKLRGTGLAPGPSRCWRMAGTALPISCSSGPTG